MEESLQRVWSRSGALDLKNLLGQDSVAFSEWYKIFAYLPPEQGLLQVPSVLSSAEFLNLRIQWSPLLQNDQEETVSRQ